MLQFEGKVVAVVSIAMAQPGYVRNRQVHLGGACAKEFARRGAHVVAIDPDEAALAQLCEEIQREGGRITALCCDITDAPSLERAAAQFRDRWDGLHALVNAHSEMEIGSIETSSIESWTRIIQADLLGPLFATRAFLPSLKSSGSASVVHIGSIDGIQGNPRLPSYSVAKGGLVPMTHLMGNEFAPHGIRVNCLARGMFIERGDAVPDKFAPLVAQTPLGRPAYADEVAAAVCFLASSDASYINGVVLPIDGGRTTITPGTREMP